MAWRDISDLIDNTEAEIGVASLTEGKRLQGGGEPNREDPWRSKKTDGGRYWVNPDIHNYWW